MKLWGAHGVWCTAFVRGAREVQAELRFGWESAGGRHGGARRASHLVRARAPVPDDPLSPEVPPCRRLVAGWSARSGRSTVSSRRLASMTTPRRQQWLLGTSRSFSSETARWLVRTVPSSADRLSALNGVSSPASGGCSYSLAPTDDERSLMRP